MSARPSTPPNELASAAPDTESAQCRVCASRLGAQAVSRLAAQCEDRTPITGHSLNLPPPVRRRWPKGALMSLIDRIGARDATPDGDKGTQVVIDDDVKADVGPEGVKLIEAFYGPISTTPGRSGKVRITRGR